MNGVELWVGPLSAYFASLTGKSADELRPGVERWAHDVGESLGKRLKAPLRWPEEVSTRAERIELGRGLDAVRLLAVHAQATDHDLPDALPVQLADDPVYREAEQVSFQKSHYGQVLVADCWLPGDFDFSFRVPRPDGEDWTFGSLAACRDQLHFLDARTFGLSSEARGELARAPVDDAASFVRQARAGLARMRRAVDRAFDHGLPVAVQRLG